MNGEKAGERHEDEFEDGFGPGGMPWDTVRSSFRDLSVLPAMFRAIAQQQALAAARADREAADARAVQQHNHEVLTSLVERMPVPQERGPTTEQAQVSARFQALRSSLGGGRTLSSAALQPAMARPQVAVDGTVTLPQALPARAAAIVVTYVDPVTRVVRKQPVRVQAVQNGVFDPGVGPEIISLEVLDQDQQLLQFGIPA